jgi:hypothetical protein
MVMNKGVKRFLALAVGIPLLMALSGCYATDTFQTKAFRAQTLAGEIVSGLRPYAILEMVTVITTKKTFIDHVAQLLTGEDCSTIRYSKGGNYCNPWYVNRPIVPQLYCYRTLAAISCYEQPSRYPGDKLVGIRQGGLQETY